MTEYKKKIALVVSHPIQHFCPQYASFAENKNVHLKVFFASAIGYKKYIDPNFKQEVLWKNLQLDKFEHQFLNGEEVLPVDKNIDAANLEDELQLFKPDLIIIYGYFQKLQRRAHSWAVRNKITLAYISDSERRQRRNWIKEIIKYPIVWNYFRQVSYFLSVGKANEEYYRFYGVPVNKIIRMHFSIDVNQYHDAYEQKVKLRHAIRKQLDISENDTVLTVVGKLVSWKNQDHIIDVMLLLETEGIYTNLVVLGSGEMLDSWKQKAVSLSKSKVHFLGFVPSDQLPAYYAATDIYVHPASIEPHSIAISEAIYMGCPIIISDSCGSYGEDDDVQEGKNGFVYPFGDISQLAKCIRKLMNDENKRVQFQEYSHNIAIKFQDISHHSVLNELYRRLNERSIQS